jgi:hypothetical protein
MGVTEKRAGNRPFFMRVSHRLGMRPLSVSAHTLQAFANHAEPREPLVLLVIADPGGHWYKGGTAA